ncbi:MAG TPA: hypothetical protein VGK84_08005 [Candidatus Tumulicola sp.]
MKLVRVCVLATGVFVIMGAAAGDAMAPLSQYLMSPIAEIALARSAAPASISQHATVMVLGTHGYTAAIRGQNGFVCIVERGWTQPFAASNFWGTEMRAPICYNAAAARTVLPYTYDRTKMVLAGASRSQLQTHVVAAIDAHTLPTPAPGAMAYMMSKSQYLNDAGKAWYSHVMVFAPMADGANAGESWGADRRLSPVVFDSSDKMPEPWSCFFIPVAHWSDGSAAPIYKGM